MPFSYLAPIFHYVAIGSKFQVSFESNENYIKQTSRNRTCIYSEKGLMNLVIPVCKQSGQKTAITQIEISYQEKWNKIHWDAICAAYNSSPFFEYYKDDLKYVYSNPPLKLWEFNSILFNIIKELIDIEYNYTFSTSFIPISEKNEYDFRYKEDFSYFNFPKYTQVFAKRWGFIPNLSIIDLLFNLGPETSSYLDACQNSFSIIHFQSLGK
ncbi:MAG: WbqC family protein [Bacteroidales bacterium]|nr:WbqC family protein [Bacteroidales bacterium]